MAWLIGMDEAGYGPNLGPFVMTAAALELPDFQCPWQLLAGAVRRYADGDDDRLVVDDSKTVYTPKHGLGPLEAAVLPFLPPADSLAELWPQQTLTPWEDYTAEPYAAALPLPTNGELRQTLPGQRARLAAVLQAADARLRLVSVVLFPRAFNALVLRDDSKAAAPLGAVQQLLRHLLPSSAPAGERIDVTIDRLGGRKHYQSFLQDVFPDQFAFTEQETNLCSSYRLGQGLTIRFLVGADQASFAVALASMVSKYLRELLMMQFNAFFQRHAPEVPPTAGYPVDAQRWWRATAEVRSRLRLPDAWLWRVR